MVACAAGTWVLGPDFQVWRFINKNYIQLLTSNIIVSFALATFVYVRSFAVKAHNREKRELAAGGHTGSMIYDFFIGRELNPRVTIPYFGEVDIKSFMELRPGMLGWIMLDLAFMAQQYKSYGYVSDSMRMSGHSCDRIAVLTNLQSWWSSHNRCTHSMLCTWNQQS
jgi:Delta14-sterol reductase